MSSDATRWAWSVSGIRASDKLVLLALCDRANDSDAQLTSWPSIRTLALDCCLNKETVIAATKRLESQGLIARRKRFSASVVYVLNCPDRRWKPSIPENQNTASSIPENQNSGNPTHSIPEIGYAEFRVSGIQSIKESKKEPKKSLTAVMVKDFPELSTAVASEFLQYRQRQQCELTPTAWKRMASEIRRSGWSAEDALAETMLRSWRGFKSDWVLQKSTTARVLREL